jgi:hypothetical protein
MSGTERRSTTLHPIHPLGMACVLSSRQDTRSDTKFLTPSRVGNAFYNFQRVNDPSMAKTTKCKFSNLCILPRVPSCKSSMSLNMYDPVCRNLIAASLIAVLALIAPIAHSDGMNASVSAIPVLNKHTAALDASLLSLRAGILKDAKECAENAIGMDATAQYHAEIKKTVETPRIAGFEVTGTSQCDGVHPNAYQYGISYRIADGKRFDLNEVYAVGHRNGGSLFLTKESVVPVMTEFKRINAGKPNCLDASTFNDEYLMSRAFTIAVQKDGSLQFYFDTSYAEVACFSPIRLDARVVDAFKDQEKAAEYGLP